MQNEYSKFLSFCHFCKPSHVRCHVNWILDFHLVLYLNSFFFLLNTENNANPYIIKPPKIYQAPESVIMNTGYAIFMIWAYLISTASKKCH